MLKAASLFFLRRLSKTLSIVRRIQRDVIKNLPVLQVKCRYYCQVLTKLELCRHISGSTETANFVKILPAGAELFRAGGRTDGLRIGRHDEVNSHFSQFCESAQNDENKNYFWSLYQ